MPNKYIIHGATYNGNGTSSAEATSNGGVGAWNNINVFEGPAVASMIQSSVLSDIEAGLKEAGIIPPEASLVDAKLIDDTYFMVKLG